MGRGAKKAIPDTCESCIHYASRYGNGRHDSAAH